jgi:uncharacterized protein (DUF39 family)
MRPAGTIMVQGDLKQMSDKWLKGISMLGYGPTMAVGLGIPIPILNAEMAAYTGVSNDELFTQVVDYAYDYPNRVSRNYGEVSYGQLMSGTIEVNGKPVQTAPLSSYPKAREIAESLKKWILDEKFTLNEPLQTIPSAEPPESS